uniref:hypothetical protein n=1 Tax=Yoonia sp. TaxID=2212373 RepID=UPI0040476AD4
MKSSKTPQRASKKSTSSKSNVKTVCSVYSITIRTGNGINLGSNSISHLVSYLASVSTYCALNVEKTGKDAHIQGAFYADPSIRQDNLRRALLPIVEKIYNDNLDPFASEKQLDLVLKHALKVVPHTNFKVLLNYCLKELTECYVLKEDPTTLLYYKAPFKLSDVLKELYENSMPKNVLKFC